MIRKVQGNLFGIVLWAGKQGRHCTLEGQGEPLHHLQLSEGEEWLPSQPQPVHLHISCPSSAQIWDSRSSKCCIWLLLHNALLLCPFPRAWSPLYLLSSLDFLLFYSRALAVDVRSLIFVMMYKRPRVLGVTGSVWGIPCGFCPVKGAQTKSCVSFHIYGTVACNFVEAVPNDLLRVNSLKLDFRGKYVDEESLFQKVYC